MKATIILILFAGILPAYIAQARRVIRCSGNVSFGWGSTMSGHTTETLSQGPDGAWYLNETRIGSNKSTDPNRVYASRYHFWQSEGAVADYDSAQRTLKFKYKYDSGFLGGGTQKTRGVFTDCTETDEPLNTQPTCRETLNKDIAAGIVHVPKQ